MFRNLIGKVHFSEHGTILAMKERATYMEFVDMLYTLDGKCESVNLALNCLDPIYCNSKKKK